MANYRLSVDNIIIVGCGGVASWLLPLLIKLCKDHGDPHIFLIDGDKLEEKNLDRQLFSEDQIGTNKAVALHARYIKEYSMMTAVEQFLLEGLDLPGQALWFGCVDNHSARRYILNYVDLFGGRAIIGGNEYTDSEAYIYEPSWKNTPLDPRVYFPEILTDQANDPTRPQSCQGLAAIEHPQLVLANYTAAAYMAQLFWFYSVQRFNLDRKETYDFWPIRHSNNFSRIQSEAIGQKMKQPKPTTAAVVAAVTTIAASRPNTVTT